VARRYGLIAVLSGLAIAPSAQAAPAYPLYGSGFERLRPGVLAAEGDIRSSPVALAASKEGAVAFGVDSDVYMVRGTRLVRVPVPADENPELAYGPTGELLVGVCPADGAGQIFAAAPDRSPTLVAGRAGKAGTAGDGGPASAASFECPSGIDVDAEGAVLVADGAAGRVRRIGPDGIIRTVAGIPRKRPADLDPFESPKPAGDGGPASAAVLALPGDVAALPGGGFAILDDDKVRIVGPDGIISTITAPKATAIAPHPDGLLILEQAGRVWRRAQDGTLTLVTDLNREAAGITPNIPVANDPFGSDEIFADDVAAAPDGGVLFTANFAVRYAPPPTPRKLALAIRPATRIPAPSLTVAVTTTRPAQLRIGVWRGGERAALVTANVLGGDASVPIPTVHSPGLYWIHIQAADHDQIAAASASVLVGARLPLRYARDFIRGRLDLFEQFGEEEHVSLACRRMTAGRIDCAMRAGKRRRCVGIASLRVERDGTLSVWQYDGGRRCRFSRRSGEPAAY
jgi:DNA-binding beta-propeller fold protein YncE